MAQELTTTTVKLPARVGALYAAIKRDDRNRFDTLPAPIDRETRKQLEEYKRDLHSRLQPISMAAAHREQAGKAIGGFLQGYINARSGDLGATLRSYVAQVSDQPVFALLAALDDFRNGRVFDVNAEGVRVPFTLDHAPSAPRLLDQVKKRAADVQEERHKVTRLLAIEHIAEPEVQADERDRVAAHMRKLADSLSMKNARLRAQEGAKIRQEADEARARAARIVEEATKRRRQQQAAHVG